MSLTPLQIERVREIIDYQSYTAAATLVLALNPTQESETAADVDQWNAVRNKYTKIEKGLLGANIDPEVQKLDIRNRVRMRLGLPRLTAESLSSPVEIVYSNPEIKTRCGARSSIFENSPNDDRC